MITEEVVLKIAELNKQINWNKQYIESCWKTISRLNEETRHIQKQCSHEHVEHVVSYDVNRRCLDCGFSWRKEL